MRKLPGALLVLLAVAGSAPAPQPRPVIIDTDAGSDDLMAIAYLLSRPEIRIEAVTVANGVAHVPAGSRNILRLLALGGHPEVPVYEGLRTPLSGNAEFPAEWRKASDDLGAGLPPASRAPELEPAGRFLATRLASAKRPSILALGPLTNLAGAFERNPKAPRGIRRLVVMGGAVRVPGNLGDGGFFKTSNTAAEWNIFVDPEAADAVFRSGVPIRLVPLDATNRVPIRMEFLKEFTRKARTPLGRFVERVLEAERPMIERGFFCAWDPLAAVALDQPRALRFRPLRIAIERKPPREGRTLETAGTPNAEVALDADAALFRRLFLAAFAAPARGR